MIVDKTSIITEYKLINDKKKSQTVVSDFLWRTFIEKISDNTFLSPAHIRWQNLDIKWHKWSVEKNQIGCSVQCPKHIYNKEQDQSKSY
jgi:hypothetical protein